MSRLVKKVAETLDKEETSKLLGHVHRAYKQSDTFYEKCLRYREDLSAGEAIDRRNLKPRGGRDWMEVELFHAYVRSMLPTVFYHNPVFKTRPIHPDYEESAKSWEDLLNAVIERTGYGEETGTCALDALCYPESWKLYTYSVKADSPDIETGEADIKDLETASGTLSDTGRKGPQTWQSFTAPVSYRVSPLQVATDCPNRTLKDSRFVVVRFKKHISELIRDPLYKLDADLKMRLKNHGGSSVNDDRPFMDMDPQNPFGNSYENHDDDLITVYEVWVHQLSELNLYKQVVYLIDGYDEKPAREIKLWSDYVGPHVDGYPINKVSFCDVPDFRPINQVETWRQLNRGMNVLLSRAYAMTKNMKRIYTLDPSNVLDPAKTKKEVLDGRLMSVIVERRSSNLTNERGPLEAIPEAPVPGDVWNGIQFISNFITQVSGLGQNQRGSAGVRTATEANLIDRFTQTRTDFLVRQFDAFMKRDAEILVKMIRHQVPDGGLVFAITGKTGGVKWGKFDEFDASWSPDVLIEEGSSRKIMIQEEQQQAAQALQAGLQAMPVLGQSVRVDELLKRYLRSLGISDVDELVPGAVIDERLLQMYEIVTMTMGQEVPVEDWHNHAVHDAQLGQFMQSETFGVLPPQAQHLMEVHAQAHQEALQQLQANAPKAQVGTGLGDFADQASAGEEGPSAGEQALAGDVPRQAPAAVGGGY